MMSILQPYACSRCGKRFGSHLSLSRHSRKHSTARPYRCRQPDCEKVFSLLSHLQQHLRQHTGARPFLCSFCGSSFRQRHHFHRHRCQQAEGAFRCQECSEAFRQRFSLNHHMVIVHKIPFRKVIRKSKAKTKLKASRMSKHRLKTSQQSGHSRLHQNSGIGKQSEEKQGQSILLKIKAGTSMTILRPRSVGDTSSPSTVTGTSKLTNPDLGLTKLSNQDDKRTSLLPHQKPENGKTKDLLPNGADLFGNKHLSIRLKKDFKLRHATSQYSISASTAEGRSLRKILPLNQTKRDSWKDALPSTRGKRCTSKRLYMPLNHRKAFFAPCHSSLLAGYRVLRKYCKQSPKARQTHRHKKAVINELSVSPSKIECDGRVRNGVVIQKDKLGRILGARQLDSPRSETSLPSACNSPRKDYCVQPGSEGYVSSGTLKVKLSPRKALRTDSGVETLYDVTYPCSARLIGESEKTKRQILCEDSDVYDTSPVLEKEYEKDYDGRLTCVNDSGVEILSSSSGIRSNGNSVHLDENSSSSHFQTEDSILSMDSPAGGKFSQIGQSSICDKCGGSVERNNNTQSPGKCCCFGETSSSLLRSVISPISELPLDMEEDSLQQCLADTDSLPMPPTLETKSPASKIALDLFQQQFLSFISHKVEDGEDEAVSTEEDLVQEMEVDKLETENKQDVLEHEMEVQKEVKIEIKEEVVDKEETKGEEICTQKTCRSRGSRTKQGRKSACPCCLGQSPKKINHSHRNHEKKLKLPQNYKQFITNTVKLLEIQEKLHQVFLTLFPDCADLIASSKVGTDQFENLLDEVIFSLENAPEDDNQFPHRAAVSTPLSASHRPDSTDNVLLGSCEGPPPLSVLGLDTGSITEPATRSPSDASSMAQSGQSTTEIKATKSPSISDTAVAYLASSTEVNSGAQGHVLSVPFTSVFEDEDSNKTIDLDLEREVQLVRTKISNSDQQMVDSDDEKPLGVCPAGASAGELGFTASFNNFRFQTDTKSSLDVCTETQSNDGCRKEIKPEKSGTDHTAMVDLEAAKISVCKNPKVCLRRLQNKISNLVLCLLPDLTLNRSFYKKHENLKFLLDLVIASNTYSPRTFDKKEHDEAAVCEHDSRPCPVNAMLTSPAPCEHGIKVEGDTKKAPVAGNNNGMQVEGDTKKAPVARDDHGMKVEGDTKKAPVDRDDAFTVLLKCGSESVTDSQMSCQSGSYTSPSHHVLDSKCARENGGHDTTGGDLLESDPSNTKVRKRQKSGNSKKNHLQSAQDGQENPLKHRVKEILSETMAASAGKISNTHSSEPSILPRRTSGDKNIFELLQTSTLGTSTVSS